MSGQYKKQNIYSILINSETFTGLSTNVQFSFLMITYQVKHQIWVSVLYFTAMIGLFWNMC